jgi:site-specific recombinase XerD
MASNTNFPALVQAFFTDRLLRQRSASSHTVAGYRDTFRLLLRFAAERFGKDPSNLSLESLDAPFIGDFLDHIEKERSNSARTRNTRLAAIHSFYRYISFHEPDSAELCRRVLAIPSKRYERQPIEYLTSEEIDALVAAPDTTTWIGRRDRALMLLGIQTGLRVSELTGLQQKDVVLETGAHVRCEGKGRKQRCTPIRPEAIGVMRKWLRVCPGEA